MVIVLEKINDNNDNDGGGSRGGDGGGSDGCGNQPRSSMKQAK